MMTLRKTVHSLLGFPDPDDRCRSISRRRRSISPPSDGAGLRCVAGDMPRSPAHVVESAAVGPRPPLSNPSPPQPQREEEKQPTERIDDGTRGLSFLYGRGGVGSGGRLELCTESLGFESCCDGKMGAEEERAEREIRKRIEEAKRRSPDARGGDDDRRGRARSTRRTEAKKEFPPPLTWLGGGGVGGGRSSSFLKAVKKDGRLLLTEVRIQRPEVLRAFRQDGRLRLEFVTPEPEAREEEDIAELEEPAAADKVLEVQGGEATAEAAAQELDEDEEEGEEEERREEQKPPPPQWQLHALALDRRREGGAGFRSRRCQEVVREGLPSSSSFWGARFVTTA